MQIERYELGPVIGTGSFATVYRGRDPRLNAPVAVKVLADNWSADPSVRFRFGQEAALLRRVRAQHRNAPLVEVFDIDEAAGGRPYFVMTFADRGTLAARMTEGGPWPGHLVSRAVGALAGGMTALHASGVVHRDLKPSNLLYTSASGAADNEQLLIGDLGLAKDLLASGSALTVAGGSPGYMAPEQATGTATVTAQADVYSASVIVMELLTGIRGVQGLDRLQPRMACEVERGLSMRPSARHDSAQEWAEAVTAALEHDGRAPASPTFLTPGPTEPGPSEPGLSEPGAGSSGPAATGGSDPVPVSDGNGSPQTPKPGQRRRLLGLVVAAVAAVAAVGAGLAGLIVFGGLFSGAPSVAVNGPMTATVGESVLLTAEVPDGGGHTWIFQDKRIVNQDLRLTPRSVGTVEVRLDYSNGDGETTSVLHAIEVQP